MSVSFVEQSDSPLGVSLLPRRRWAMSRTTVDCSNREGWAVYWHLASRGWGRCCHPQYTVIRRCMPTVGTPCRKEGSLYLSAASERCSGSKPKTTALEIQIISRSTAGCLRLGRETAPERTWRIKSAMLWSQATVRGDALWVAVKSTEATVRV